MDFRNGEDQPTVRVVATHTIVSNTLVVNIRMTRDTIVVHLLENQAFVTCFTVYLLVVSFKGEIRYVMVE
jgi:hypothetical protein